MKFKSRRDTFFSISIFSLNAFLIGMQVFGFVSGEIKDDEAWISLVILAVVLLLFWLYFGTSYKITQKELLYRSGPFNGKIKISDIREIIQGKTLWVGNRPATARNGLIVKYEKYNEIYISPKTNDKFIEAILNINPEINVSK